MHKLFLISFAAIMVMILVFTGSCGGGITKDEALTMAQTFIENDTTYLFDGLEDTLTLTDTITIDNGWQFTYKFDSRYAGYGDRTGEMLAEVITPHTAVIKVVDGKVASAIMDAYWDMISRQPVAEIEITLTPIEEVTVFFMKSNPAQVGVHFVGGLPSGCTTFYDIEITRDGTTINIKVTNQQPKDTFCPAIYTTFEKDVNLGSDFTVGTTYTLNVNDHTTTFNY